MLNSREFQKRDLFYSKIPPKVFLANMTPERIMYMLQDEVKMTVWFTKNLYALRTFLRGSILKGKSPDKYRKLCRVVDKYLKEYSPYDGLQ